MGSGLEGLALLCGQLTRCFSAVAELLVDFNEVNYCASVFALFARIEFIMTILNSTQLKFIDKR